MHLMALFLLGEPRSVRDGRAEMISYDAQRVGVSAGHEEREGRFLVFVLPFFFVAPFIYRGLLKKNTSNKDLRRKVLWQPIKLGNTTFY